MNVQVKSVNLKTSICLSNSTFFTFLWLFRSAIEWQQLNNQMFPNDDKLCL